LPQPQMHPRSLCVYRLEPHNTGAQTAQLSRYPSVASQSPQGADAPEMSKRDDYIHKLLPLFDAHIATGDDEELLDYLTSNSNLPGPRGNLELAEAFGDATAQCAAHDKLHHLCQTMTQVSADEAPAGDPREFIPFCGTVGIGALGAASPYASS
jgi:hypothetical protein